eukprot:GHVH01008845.1.p1 GENE.GHVH01008845.1~~GHVH01008845.1.p1  ORF type:complete len:814 (+),score=81.45 GHVH01008845.1:273-2444(+)
MVTAGSSMPSKPKMAHMPILRHSMINPSAPSTSMEHAIFDPVKRNSLHASLTLSILRAIRNSVATDGSTEHPTGITKHCTAGVMPVMGSQLKWVVVRWNANEMYKVNANLVFNVLGTRRVKRLLNAVPVVKVLASSPASDQTLGIAGEDAKFQIMVDGEGWSDYYSRLESDFFEDTFMRTRFVTLREFEYIASYYFPIQMSNVYSRTPRDSVSSIAKLLHEEPCRRYRNEQKGDTLMCEICEHLLFQPVMLQCGHVYCYRCIKRRADDANPAIRQKICVLCLPQLQPSRDVRYKIVSYPSSVENEQQLKTYLSNILKDCNQEPVARSCRTDETAEVLINSARTVMKVMSAISKVIDSIIVQCPQLNCKWAGYHRDLTTHLALHGGRSKLNNQISHTEPIISERVRLACYQHSAGVFRHALYGARRALGLYPDIDRDPLLGRYHLSELCLHSARTLCEGAVIKSSTAGQLRAEMQALIRRLAVRVIGHLMGTSAAGTHTSRNAEGYAPRDCQGDRCPGWAQRDMLSGKSQMEDLSLLVQHAANNPYVTSRYHSNSLNERCAAIDDMIAVVDRRIELMDRHPLCNQQIGQSVASTRARDERLAREWADYWRRITLQPLRKDEECSYKRLRVSSDDDVLLIDDSSTSFHSGMASIPYDSQDYPSDMILSSPPDRLREFPSTTNPSSLDDEESCRNHSPENSPLIGMIHNNIPISLQREQLGRRKEF